MRLELSTNVRPTFDENPLPTIARLAGAMAELNYKADILDWVETWTFNAPKCMAVFKEA